MAKTAATGYGPTKLVAIEQHFPESTRIINDDLAEPILPFRTRASLRLWMLLLPRDRMVAFSERRTPGLWGGLLCRKRYLDDRLAEAAGGQVETVVNLGAGMDTQAYRLPALAKLRVFEVDLPVNIATKRSRLKKVLGEVPSHVTLVPVDFDRGNLEAVLASHGYATDARTFFVWEGVTQYLTEAGVRATMDFLAKGSAGSRLAFTYVRKDFVDGEVLYGHEYIYKTLVLKGKNWRFGIDPENVADFLSGYGWRMLEHLGFDELAERYVKPTGRKLLSMPLERMVYAEKL